MLEALFQPVTIGNLTLPNRFVMAPMSRYACPDLRPTAALKAYHRRRAQHGVGLMLTGGAAIDHPSANNSPMLAGLQDHAMPAWEDLVRQTHDAGGLISAQLWHAGGHYNRESWWQPAPISSPSGLGAANKIVGDPLTEEEIADIIDAYGRSASATMQAGFDAIEIHAAHGFLIDQFFWEETNRRTDKWGGPKLTDRLEFALDVYRSVRRAVGPDVPVSIRISQWKEQNYETKLAATPDELAGWLGPFVDAGIDFVNCSQRRFWEAEFAGADLNLAAWVKKLTGAKTMTVGSIGLDCDVMESFSGEKAAVMPLDLLAERFERGDFDLVGVGRGLLADPCWVEKVREGRFSELSSFEPSAADLVH